METTVTPDWQSQNPEAAVGFLGLSFAEVPQPSPALDRAKQDLEQELRTAYPDRATMKAEPVIAAYVKYYKQFKSSYHVLLQLDSVALKGKSMPRIAPLVEAMFAAELKNQVLTSGHDLDAVDGFLTMGVAQGGEAFTSLAGKDRTVKSGDAMLSDGTGCVGSIIYGPDRRTRLRPRTKRAVYVAWGVPGVGREPATRHLDHLESLAKLIDPNVETLFKRVV